MGVSNFMPMLKKYASDAIIYISYNDIIKNAKCNKMIVGIDANMLIYRVVLALRNANFEMTNKDGELTSHIYGIFMKIIILLESNILPIFVFDGEMPEIKKNTVELRDKKRIIAEKAIKSGKLNKEQKHKESLKTFVPTLKIIAKIKILLTLCGVPYFQAENEADTLLVYLNNKKIIDGIISDDTDISVFGGKNQYYNFFEGMKTKNKNKSIILQINYETIIKKLKWTRKQYINAALLLGTDYTPHIKGLGVSSVKNIVDKNVNPSDLIDYDIDIFNNAYDYYYNVNISDPIKDKINNFRCKNKKIHYDEPTLKYFLIDLNDMNPKTVDKNINRLITAIKNYNLS